MHPYYRGAWRRRAYGGTGQLGLYDEAGERKRESRRDRALLGQSSPAWLGVRLTTCRSLRRSFNDGLPMTRAPTDPKIEHSTVRASTAKIHVMAAPYSVVRGGVAVADAGELVNLSTGKSGAVSLSHRPPR
jgi:hypothetical protein